MEKCLFPVRVVILVSVVNNVENFLPICTLTWRVNKYNSRQGKGIHRRNESNNIFLNFVSSCTSWIESICPTQSAIIN